MRIEVGKWGSVELVVRDLPAHGKRVSLYIRAQRLRCEDCTKTSFEPLPALADGRRMTKRLVAWIRAQSLKRVFTTIAEETGVHERSIRRIFRDYIHELEAQTTFETPRWLGIDEIHILKRPRCVITNVSAAEDIADAIRFVVTRPRHVAVNEILVRPPEQER